MAVIVGILYSLLYGIEFFTLVSAPLPILWSLAGGMVLCCALAMWRNVHRRSVHRVLRVPGVVVFVILAALNLVVDVRWQRGPATLPNSFVVLVVSVGFVVVSDCLVTRARVMLVISGMGVMFAMVLNMFEVSGCPQLWENRL